MSSENSAVSDLLRRTHTRRLRTDPADSFLFQPATAERGPARRTAPGATRWGEDLSAVAEVVVPAQHLPVPRPVARPSRPELRSNRSYAWLLVLATIVAGGLGVGGAWYFDRADTNHGATVQDIVAQIAATPVPIAAPVAAPAPVATPAPAAAPVEQAPTVPTVTPTIESKPAIESKPTANAPAHVAHKHATKKRVATAKRAKSSAHLAVEKPVAAAPETPDPPAAKPAAPVSRKPVAQHDDNEDPLR